MPDHTHAIEAFIFLVLAAGVVYHEVDKRRHTKAVIDARNRRIVEGDQKRDPDTVEAALQEWVKRPVTGKGHWR